MSATMRLMGPTYAAMNSRQYEIRVVAILCLTVGVVNFDMIGIGVLMPFIEPTLKLTNTQIGILLSSFYVTFALSTYLVGTMTDKFGKHKTILQFTLLLFSAASLLSGLATSFSMLLAARLLMGFLDGPIYLIPQTIVVLESPTERSGMNMGIVQNCGTSILAGFVGPLLLVSVSAHHSWRIGFFLVAIPGLICTTLVSRYFREPTINSEDETAAVLRGAAGIVEVLRFRNVWLCSITSCFVVAYIIIGFGYLPLYFINVRHFSSGQMSGLMSVLGVSGLVLGPVLPAISDRVGRKPVVFSASLLGILCPLAAMYYSGPIIILGVLTFLGWALVGAAPLVLATIPCESVPARSMSTAMGFIVALSTLLGGVLGPALAGWSADRWGLSMPLRLVLGCCCIIALTSLALSETAPQKVAAQGGHEEERKEGLNDRK